MTEKRYITLSLSQDNAKLVSETEFLGRKHMVVPIIALVEGVITAGNTGVPELVLASEFSKSVDTWNGRILTLDHPSKDGKVVSANTPSIYDSSSLGLVFNSKVEDNKLKVEGFVDVERAKAKGGEFQTAVDRLKAGDAVEVSVGVNVNVDPTSGTRDGKEFTGIWRNITPDHLAILRGNEKGACSNEMGCGAPRVNNELKTAVLPEPEKGEKERDFISRCMMDTVAKNDFPDIKQRLAVCFKQFDSKKRLEDNRIVSKEFNNFFLVENGSAKDLGNNPPSKLDRSNPPSTTAIVKESNGKNTASVSKQSLSNAKDEARAIVEREKNPKLKVIVGEAVGILDDKVVFQDREGFEWRAEAAAVCPCMGIVSIGAPAEDSCTYNTKLLQSEDRMAFEPDTNSVTIGNTMDRTASILSIARTPKFDGTETISWATVDKSLSACIKGWNLKFKDNLDTSTPVSALTQEVKNWIADKSLLGNPKADTFADLLFFPVVNPVTYKLNEGGLRAVISGRGSMANIPAAARDSAQAEARKLLNAEFGTNLEASYGEKAAAILYAFRKGAKDTGNHSLRSMLESKLENASVFAVLTDSIIFTKEGDPDFYSAMLMVDSQGNVEIDMSSIAKVLPVISFVPTDMSSDMPPEMPLAPQSALSESKPECECKAKQETTEMTLEQFIESAPDGIKDTISESLGLVKEQRASLIQQIKELTNAFTDDDLNAMSRHILNKLVSSLKARTVPATASTLENTTPKKAIDFTINAARPTQSMSNFADPMPGLIEQIRELGNGAKSK